MPRKTLGENMIYASILLGLPLAFIFWGAGFNKLTKSIDDLAAAGMGWTKEIPVWVVRLIALLEIAGAIGVVAGPVAGLAFGWTWATFLGALAGAGLAATMLVAAIMHIARGEFKYTYKMNIAFLLLATAHSVVTFLS
jgi:uncharacterized membrane protein YphA (DoxX/SURF4 family)